MRTWRLSICRGGGGAGSAVEGSLRGCRTVACFETNPLRVGVGTVHRRSDHKLEGASRRKCDIGGYVPWPLQDGRSPQV